MDWVDTLEFFHTPKFKRILSFLKEEERHGKTILPEQEDRFNAFSYTPLDNVKVVILGQDPYPDAQYPMGLSFSVRPTVSKLPASLVNIFKELENDIGTKRTNGDLSDWASRGVLLLNTSLTVVEGQPGSHRSIGWNGLIRDVFGAINEYQEDVVYVLWGRHAQQYEKFVDKNKHHVIKSVHPSPLSAYRGFFGSYPFSKINKYLTDKGIEPIQWT